MSLPEILLEISKKDLEAANVLYQNKLYPQAIFYLQQSVEKAAKSFGLIANIIDEDELKSSIRHRTLELYKKIMNEQKQKIITIKKGLEVFPRLKNAELIKILDIEKQEKLIKDFERFYKSITKGGENLIFISKDEIRMIIRDLNKLELEFQETKKKLEEFSASEEEFKKMRAEIEKLMEEFSALINGIDSTKDKELKSALSDGKFERTLKVIFEKLIPVLLEVYYINLSLFYLGIITFPHAVTARYPEKGLNPLEIYNEQHSLIQLFEECSELLNKTIVKFEEFLAVLEEWD